jgi:hypothetical protein
MTQSNTGAPEEMKEAKLPLRDWVLLAMLSLVTICLMAVGTELIARWICVPAEDSLARCLIGNDPSTGVRAVPNSVCHEQVYENQLTEYKFNSCGHRAGVECGPKPSGAYRIVMVGSSVALGDRVEREKIFAALLPAELSQLTGKKVELYNEAMRTGTPPSIALRFNEVLAAKPDVILWVLVPYDISNVSLILPVIPPHNSHSLFAWDWSRVRNAFDTEPFPNAISDAWKNALDVRGKLQDVHGELQFANMLRHFLYESQSQYVKSYLLQGDDAGFLRDSYSAEIAGKAQAAGVPLVAVLVPNRAQAAMISMGEWPAGFDPYKLNDRLRSIVVSHGGTYIDILPDFRGIPNPEQYWFPLDGHPDASGHAVIAALLAKELTGGAIPTLRVAAQPPAGLEQGR